jgi:proteic killer suppression protein
MDLSFKNGRLAKIFNSETLLRREFGAEQARCIMSRLIFLQASPTLASVPIQPPYRRHQLTGNRDEQFAVDLKGPYRLVFEPNHDPIPRKDDGGIDLNQVAAITILGMEDYH